MAAPSPQRPQTDVDVFGYLDVRVYLADYYAARKALGRGFSYRYFARKAGMRSPNHLKRVIDGGRPLTAAMAVRYAEALDLEGEERAYFIDLAAFCRSKTTDERNAAYERLSRYRQARSAQRLDRAHALYHATWYIPAIRELVDLPGFREDPGWIAHTLVPPISRSQAAKALGLLQELGLLIRDDAGRLVQSDAVITTGPETRGLHIANYHRAMLERAAESIDLVHRTERDISSLTFGCSDEVMAEIKTRLVAFRRELIALISASEVPAERVVQLNFQMFPLSAEVPESE